MKRLAVFLFLTSYLLCATELNQLLRIQVLVEHFLEHRQLKKDITFLEYLSNHYSNEESDNDDQRDRQLPFKSTQSQLLFINEYVANNSEGIPVCFTSLINTLNSQYKNPDLGSEYSSNIWQPPKSI